MIPISFEDQLTNLVPEVRLGLVSCDVHVLPGDERINEITRKIIDKVRSEFTISDVSFRQAIKSTKDAYRSFGKDPSRYRPSAEALTRRIVNGKDLYQINNIVDLLNLVSLESGFSIGGYDINKIEGEVEFGIGKPDEPYHAIGRGVLNIENLPVFRDNMGAFGSPTSDSVRTMVSDSTTKFLMVIIDFGLNDLLQPVMEKSAKMYKEYTNATNIEFEMVVPTE